MAETTQAPKAATSAPSSPAADRVARVEPARVTGWVGFIVFAGVMLILAGAMQAANGLVAIFNDEWVVFTNRTNLMFDLTAWGWIHLAFGALLVLAGIGVITGNVVARWVAVVLAGLSMIANFLFLPAYPVWGVVLITIDALVIYALIAHGREIRLP